MYEELFRGLEGGNLLEIGVGKGGSLEILRQAFPRWKMVGLDINESVLEINLPGIEVYLGSQTDYDTLRRIVNSFESSSLDLVIDDGSHRSRDSIVTLEYLWKYLNPGGAYVIEDTHTSYWSEFGGGLKKSGTVVEYAKSLADQLNRGYVWRWRKKRFDNFLTGLDSVTFMDSLVVLRKGHTQSPTVRLTVPEGL
jgi:cephalosporin hydroxylase